MYARMNMDCGNIAKLSGKECRLMIVGKTGSGKSSLANTLLGEDLCDVSVFGESLTKDTKLYSRTRFYKDIRVVDTPGLFDNRPEMTTRVILSKLAQTALILAPGPHAILLTMVCGQRFTTEEEAVVTHIRSYFGEEILKYIIVVFTRGDDLETKGFSIKDYVDKAPQGLKDLLDLVGYRYVVINNVMPDKQQRDDNVRVLLDLVEKTTRHATQPFFSSDLFREAEERMILLDQAVSRQFRPRSDSTSSQDSMTDSMSRQLVHSIMSSDSGIASETSLPTQEQLEAGDREVLKTLAATLVRQIGRKQVSDGKQEPLVNQLIDTEALASLLSALKVDNEKEIVHN